MSYCVSHMIGIRTGGVFSGAVNHDDLRQRIAATRERFIAEHPHLEKPTDGVSESDPEAGALSHEINGSKGSYVVIAGVFNYWNYNDSSLFVAALSKEFGTEVMHMCWDEECDTVQCNIWLDGKPLLEVNENPIGQILRRVG